MTQINMMVPPPDNWQDFERLTFSVCEAIWPNDNVQQYSRPGQAQQGVDIYKSDSYTNALVGVQCKRKNPTDAFGNQEVGGQLTLKEINAEVQKAAGFRPPLDELIIATTASRDSQLQAELRSLNSDRLLAGEFRVSVWFWEDIQSRLNQHIHVMYRYYKEFMQSTSAYDVDKHILSMLHMAFSRPAYNTYLHLENNCAHLLQAIKDTQSAIKTGVLKDRENGDVLRSVPFGASELSKPEWRESLASIYKLLSEVRDDYTNGIKMGAVKQYGSYTEIQDHALSAHLNQTRGMAIRQLNVVLSEAGVDQVESKLL